MKRILMGLAASAAMLSVSSGAFASSQLDRADSASVPNGGAIQLAQASGGGTGTGGTTGNTGGAGSPNPSTGQLNEPDEQTIGAKPKSGTTGSGAAPATSGTAGTGTGTPEKPHDRIGTSSTDQTGSQIK